jgi:hypothetical protein
MFIQVYDMSAADIVETRIIPTISYLFQHEGLRNVLDFPLDDSRRLRFHDLLSMETYVNNFQTK